MGVKQLIFNHTLTNQEQVIAYLASELCDNGMCSFKWFGPHSFYFNSSKTPEDKILIYVNKSNLVIVHDGKYVIDGCEMFRLNDMSRTEHQLNNQEYYEKVEEYYDSYYLQPILALF